MKQIGASHTHSAAVFLFIFFIIIGNLYPQTPNYPDPSTKAVYKISADARETLLEMKLSVRHGRIDGDFVAELSPAEAGYLSGEGFRLEKLFDSVKEENKYYGTDEFHSYTQMKNEFIILAAEHPDIASYHVFGTSVQNRDIFALKITTNPGIEEDEPEVVFWGCIHGNEYAAAEIPYLYAIYLCENYGIIPEVTGYIQNNEIWVYPIINTDGRVNGTRNNANNVDLNRDLAYQWDGWGSSPAPLSQPETQALREFLMANNSVISVSYHCSGDEMYHPWGFWSHSVPDYNVFNVVGGRYANLADYDFFSSFASYPTHGEILDWAYGCFGGLSFTTEISNSSANVNTTFNRNRPGMNLFCSVAGEGLRGVVTDAQTSEPLWASVWINGNAFPAYTDPVNGDMHRMVLPGTYDLTVWANGYLPQSVNNVVVERGIPGQFNVSLQSGGGEHAFMVTSVKQNDPNNAFNNRTYPSWALGAPDTIPCSIGSNGFLVLDMGEGHEIFDGPGADFTVTEAYFDRDSIPESYRVFTGTAYSQTIHIGDATGTSSFDLNGTGVTSARYLKIVDNSGAPYNGAVAGMDLDAVTVINGTGDIASYSSILSQYITPEDFAFCAYPNPFNARTVTSFKLQVSSYVNLTVFDITGREVAKLVDGMKPAGSHQIVFDAKNLTSGVYFARLEAGEFRGARKILLLK